MSQLQDPPPWQGDPPAPAGPASGTADSPRALLLAPATLTLGTRGLSFPSFSSRNIPELTCHPGAHPRSHGDCLPSALRNHLWLAAVGTQHSCPLPAAWPNKQRCFLLRLALPSWVSYPSTHTALPHAPHCSCSPPQLPTAPRASHTHTLACLGAKGRDSQNSPLPAPSVTPPKALANTRRTAEVKSLSSGGTETWVPIPSAPAAL